MIQYVVSINNGARLVLKCQPHKEFKLTTILRNLPHPPTSAYFPQGRGEHIQVDHLFLGHLKHIESRE